MMVLAKNVRIMKLLFLGSPAKGPPIVNQDSILVEAVDVLIVQNTKYVLQMGSHVKNHPVMQMNIFQRRENAKHAQNIK